MGAPAAAAAGAASPARMASRRGIGADQRRGLFLSSSLQARKAHPLPRRRTGVGGHRRGQALAQQLGRGRPQYKRPPARADSGLLAPSLYTETIGNSTSGATGGRGLAGLVAAEQCGVQQCCAGARWKMRWSCWRWVRFSVLSPGRPRSTFDFAARPGILMSPLHLIIGLYQICF